MDPQKIISAGKGGHLLDTTIFRFHLKLQGCFCLARIFAALSLNDLQEKPELVDGKETPWLVDVKIPNAWLMCEHLLSTVMPIDTNQPTAVRFVINHTVFHGLLLVDVKNTWSYTPEN